MNAQELPQCYPDALCGVLCCVREPLHSSRLVSRYIPAQLQHCLRADSLCAHGLQQVQEAAGRLAARMKQEPSGTQAAVDAFHRYMRSMYTVTEAVLQNCPQIEACLPHEYVIHCLVGLSHQM